MRFWQIICFLPFLLIISCSGNKIVKDTNVEKGAVDKNEEVSPSFPFILGTGDEITVNVWRNDDLNRTVQIDPSGNIYLPLAGEIQASGLTISQLRGKIVSGLSKYIIDPQVDINVSGLKSNRVHVLGEVKSPGTFPLDTRMLAWEAISKAGGFTNDANKKEVLLVKSENGVARVAALNIHSMLKTGELYQDVYLRNGDVIYVPPSFIANLERFMQRFNNIMNPFITLERGIIFSQDARKVLQGEEVRGVVVAP